MLLEWCALIEAARQEAFGLLLLTILESTPDLHAVFDGETNEVTTLKQYMSLVDKVLDSKAYFDINTVQQLYEKTRTSLGRLRNEGSPGMTLQDKISRIIKFCDQEVQEMSLSATTTTTAEAQDVAGVGRKLTASESHSMRTMRTAGENLWRTVAD